MIFALSLTFQTRVNIAANSRSVTASKVGQVTRIKQTINEYTIIRVPRRYLSYFEDDYQGEITNIRFVVPGDLSREEQEAFIQERIND